MINRVIWFFQRLVDLMNKDESRIQTKDILRKRNAIYEKMLNMDKKDEDVREVRGWVNALDWVVGGNK
jgi:hypothetical protein